MGYYKIGRSVLVSLLVVLSASFVPRLPMVLMTSRVLAQSKVEREAEADRLFQQGNQHFKAIKANSDFAIETWRSQFAVMAHSAITASDVFCEIFYVIIL